MDRFLGPQMYKLDSANLEEYEDDEQELRRMKSRAKKEGEKVFIQMVINDYICKGRTWEDLQKDFRPSGAMSKWTRDTAELLGLNTTTNYNLMSPLKGSMKKRRKKSKKSSKGKKGSKGSKGKKGSKAKPKKSKSRRYKLTKRK